VAHACNPSSLGGWDLEDCDLRPAWANSSWDPQLQNNQSEMDWRCGSNCRTPAFQVPSPEFETSVPLKKRKL
jgi:hypothetical protein